MDVLNSGARAEVASGKTGVFTRRSAVCRGAIPGIFTSGLIGLDTRVLYGAADLGDRQDGRGGALCPRQTLQPLWLGCFLGDGQWRSGTDPTDASAVGRFSDLTDMAQTEWVVH